MAIQPTIYIVASDQTRNGKTFVARLLVDYLMLDGRDPFVIDTDAPEGPLRNFFPGRTALADFASIKGQMKLFDTILAAPGRDYVVDLSARHSESFFAAERDLSFFAECRKAGFRLFVFFVVDESFTSAKAARDLQRMIDVDLFVPVRNMMVRSAWPEDDGALTLPYLAAPVANAVGNKRFSLRRFVQGDTQGLGPDEADSLQSFLFETLNNLANLEPLHSMAVLTEKRH